MKSLKPIQLPEPPSPTAAGATPDIFQSGAHTLLRRALVIGNGFPSSENHCIGLLRVLGLSHFHLFYRVTRPKGGINDWLQWLPLSLHKKIHYLISIFVPFLTNLTDVNHIVNLARQTYEKEGPLLVVASGRDTVSVASSIKRLASDHVFVVQIQHPRLHLNRFDMVITPHHDYYYPLTPEAQKQVPKFLRRWISPREPPESCGMYHVLTLGALHQIYFASLRSAAITWHDVFAHVPRPLLVVHIGRPTKNCRYGADLGKPLATSLLSVLGSCGSVRISFSERTPQKVSNIIVKELGNNPKVYIWDGQEPNPHIGHLAWADAFVVTANSVSMISEACSTGKPVYIMGAERCRWKFTEFHKSLRERGVVRPFTGSEDISENWSYPPLNDTADAAKRVHEALAARGWKLKI
ncbi:mitochondrial fission protein ELM1-like [Abrus precatorius]|uniref:Mitochondrial fission protein ELM1-like n=1 Tax=Abrus precatorius TaxID=3816 RepID=A0A8B8KHW3_ABRPR|nr:mitochondrial fission protein ELM1-like [Abrus precatorius]